MPGVIRLCSGTLALLAALFQGRQGERPTSPPDCGWRETEPAQFANRRDGIEWGSDADLVGPAADSAYGFARFLANTGPTSRLVQWEAGRVLVPALAPGQVATLCERLPMRPYMVYGPIAVEGGKTPVHTTVWEAGYDTRNLDRLRGRVLETVFTITTADDAPAGVVSIRVVTTLLPQDEGRGFKASYALENRGHGPVEVMWPLGPGFLRAARLPRSLGPPESDSARVSWESEPGLPVFVHVPLLISVPDARTAIAIVAIPTFVVREGSVSPP